MRKIDITGLINQVRAGRDENAAARLWGIYYPRLVEVARRGLKNHPKRMADEEDVASSALRSFFFAAENGRLDELQNRDELWKLLLTITIRKANRYKQRAMAQKRGGGIVDAVSGFAHGSAANPVDLESVVDMRLTKGFMEDCHDLINLLPNSSLQEIALRRLEGFTVQEIATAHGVVPSTIKRKLAHIREIWTEASMGPDS